METTATRLNKLNTNLVVRCDSQTEQTRHALQLHIVSINVHSISALRASCLPFLSGGGLLISNAGHFESACRLLLLLQLPTQKKRIALLAEVVYRNFRNAKTANAQEVGVRFLNKNSCVSQLLEKAQ